MMTTLHPGELVYAKDGALLGTVSAVREGLFKLDAPMKLDYWLPLDCLALREDDVAVTCFPRAELDDYRIESGSVSH